MMRPFASLALLSTLLIAGCAAPPRPKPVPPPKAAPALPSSQASTDWRDLPETKGAWRYDVEGQTTAARFENAGALLFAIRCDKTMHRVALRRPDTAAGAPLTVTTSYGKRTLTTPDLAAGDPLLDQIAFSRGRFTIEAPARPELVLPAWAEPDRVIEDCRG